MPYLNIPKSTLASGLSILLGQIKGRLLVKVQKDLDKLQENISKQCGNSEQLLKLSKNLENIKNLITNTKTRISKIKNITEPLSVISTSITIAINLLKLLPTPASTETAGTLTTRADLLHSLKEQNKQISDNINSINLLIQGSSISVLGLERLITIIEQKIQILQNRLQQCLNEETVENLNTEISESVVRENSIPFTTAAGVSYNLEVIVIEESGIAPLRQAIAKDRFGIIRFNTSPSYSSSTDVLLEELKFIIENQT
jgi:hypothetical protein